MSEALSTTEIEDVLSSIRRLVADDLRPFAPVPRPVVDPVAPDKLLLTPALRVVANDADFVPSPRVTAALSSMGAEIAQTADWEPEAGDADVDADLGQPLDMSQQDWNFEPIAQESDLRDDFSDTPGDDNLEQFDQDELLTRSEPVTNDFDIQDDEPLSEPAFVSVRHMHDAEAVPGWAQSDAMSEGVDGDPEPASAVGTIEPDADWADAAEADVIAELAIGRGFAPEEVAAPDWSDETGTDEFAADPGEPLYDEALLREIVRDMLREELQGNMGERITRNIRKLVRAEIARALATQDMV